MATDEQIEIREFITAYFIAQSAFDGVKMLDFWHSDGMMYLVGNQSEFRVVAAKEQAEHIKAAKEHNPDLAVKFVLDEVEQVILHEELIASVHVQYRMVFPEGHGKHRCFFNLAKMDGKWKIANVVDRGFQILTG